MTSPHLATYLRDHRAGAQAALQIIDHIEASHGDSDAGSVVRQLRPEIQEDVNVLDQLIERLGIPAGGARRAFGWMGEQLVELKLKVDDPADGDLRLMESLEVLSLGIEGKLALWKALEASAVSEPRLATLDFAHHIARTRNQRERAEAVRLEAAQVAFRSDAT